MGSVRLCGQQGLALALTSGHASSAISVTARQQRSGTHVQPPLQHAALLASGCHRPALALFFRHTSPGSQAEIMHANLTKHLLVITMQRIIAVGFSHALLAERSLEGLVSCACVAS